LQYSYIKSIIYAKSVIHLLYKYVLYRKAEKEGERDREREP
jgi:hypothetical protein